MSPASESDIKDLLREADDIARGHRAPFHTAVDRPSLSEVLTERGAGPWPSPGAHGQGLRADWGAQIDEATARATLAVDAVVNQLTAQLRADTDERLALLRADSAELGAIADELRGIAEELTGLAATERQAALASAIAEADALRRSREADLSRLIEVHLSEVGAALGDLGVVARQHDPPPTGPRRRVIALGSRADGSTLWVPTGANLIFAGDGEATRRASWAAVTKVLWSAPTNLTRLRFCDPVGLGNSMGPLFALYGCPDLVGEAPAGSQAEIDIIFDWARTRIRDLATNALRGVHPTLDDFNAQAPRPHHGVHLVAYRVGPGWSARSIDALLALADTGPAAGVSLIVTIDDRDPTFAAKLIERFRAGDSSLVLTDCRAEGSFITADDDGQVVALVGVPSTQEPDLREALAGFAQEAEGAVARPKPDGSAEISVPVGFGANDEVALTLGQDPVHALVVGRTGSGKTSMLHTFIHHAAQRYSPEQLELWLVDLKEGVEFTQYAGEGALPQVRVVGQASEPEFGMRILEALRAEGVRRGSLFRAQKVDHIARYREVSGEALPAIVCVIDECHIVLADGQASRSVTAQSWKHIEWLAKEGRSFGLHLVLATQSVRGMGMNVGSSGSVWGQIALRVALRCDPGDAALVFGESNRAATGLQFGQAVVNDNAGDPAANVLVDLTYLDPDARAAIRHEVCSRWQPRGPQKVLTGDELPAWQPVARTGALRFSLGRPISLDEVLEVEVDPGEHHSIGVFGPPEGTAAVLAAAVLDLHQQLPDHSFTLVAPNGHPVATTLAQRLGASVVELEDVEGVLESPADVLAVFDAGRWQLPEGASPYSADRLPLAQVLQTPRVVTLAGWAAFDDVTARTGVAPRNLFDLHVHAAGALDNRLRGEVESQEGGKHAGFLEPVTFLPWAPVDPADMVGDA